MSASFIPASLSDQGFRRVGRCTALETLAFNRDTTDAATEYIAELPNLKSFFAGGARITDRSLAILARMASLETVDVHGSSALTDAGISELASLPKLSTLVVYDCPHVTPAAMAAFPAHVRVKRAGD